MRQVVVDVLIKHKITTARSPLDACIIATVKNRYKAWLNKLPIGECPDRWIKIKKFVECIKETGKETILKGWEKTKLSDGFDLDDMMRDPDFEEEFLLSEKMAELMLDDELIENELNDVIEVNADKENEENEVPDVNAEKGKETTSDD